MPFPNENFRDQLRARHWAHRTKVNLDFGRSLWFNCRNLCYTIFRREEWSEHTRALGCWRSATPSCQMLGWTSTRYIAMHMRFSTIPFQVFVNFSLANNFLHNQSSWCPQILPVDVESTWLLEYIFYFFLGEVHTTSELLRWRYVENSRRL
jgi:hypothetical protein